MKQITNEMVQKLRSVLDNKKQTIEQYSTRQAESIASIRRRLPPIVDGRVPAAEWQRDAGRARADVMVELAEHYMVLREHGMLDVVRRRLDELRLKYAADSFECLHVYNHHVA